MQSSISEESRALQVASASIDRDSLDANDEFSSIFSDKHLPSSGGEAEAFGARSAKGAQL